MLKLPEDSFQSARRNFLAKVEEHLRAHFASPSVSIEGAEECIMEAITSSAPVAEDAGNDRPNSQGRSRDGCNAPHPLGTDILSESPLFTTSGTCKSLSEAAGVASEKLKSLTPAQLNDFFSLHDDFPPTEDRALVIAQTNGLPWGDGLPGVSH